MEILVGLMPRLLNVFNFSKKEALMSFAQQLITFDNQLLIEINSCNSAYFDNFMYLISKVGIWAFLYGSIIYVLIREYKKKAWILILLLILCVVLTDQVSVFIKESVERLRPSHNPDLADIIHLVKNKKGGMYGFVSSHAANVVGFATLTALYFRNNIYTISMAFWAILICYSRIYLGMHYPLDCIGGAITGFTIAVVIYYLFKSKTNSFTSESIKYQRIPITTTLLTLVGISIYSFF
jgi:undecaprenyl-diphosphatase